MIIEKFIVKDMSEAMALARESLGEEAIILTQRTVREKGWLGFFRPVKLEVTMAVEERPVKKTPFTKNARLISNGSQTQSSLINTIQPDEPFYALIKELERMESFQSFSASNQLRSIEDPKLREMFMTHFLQQELESRPFGNFMQEACVAFVGSTGVGKTTTIAKIAAHAKLSYGKKIGFITIDTYRIGAVEQLKIYADIMDIPMLTVMAPADMRTAYQKLAKTCDLVLVDTLGTSYRNHDQIDDIRRYLDQIEGLRRVAVLTATLDIEVFEKTLEAYELIGMDFTILTKLDEMDANTRLFSYVRRLTAPLSYITTGQNVPDDLQEASTPNLMSYLWEAHEQNERPGA